MPIELAEHRVQGVGDVLPLLEVFALADVLPCIGKAQQRGVVQLLDLVEPFLQMRRHFLVDALEKAGDGVLDQRLLGDFFVIALVHQIGGVQDGDGEPAGVFLGELGAFENLGTLGVEGGQFEFAVHQLFIRLAELLLRFSFGIRPRRFVPPRRPFCPAFRSLAIAANFLSRSSDFARAAGL